MRIPNLVLIRTTARADMDPMKAEMNPWKVGNRIVGLDPDRRRLWVGGQRLHHGLTGVALAAAGLVLIAHDWKDRSYWFRLGRQSD
jgi:hypothetical protein